MITKPADRYWFPLTIFPPTPGALRPERCRSGLACWQTASGFCEDAAFAGALISASTSTARRMSGWQGGWPGTRWRGGAPSSLSGSSSPPRSSQCTTSLWLRKPATLTWSSGWALARKKWRSSSTFAASAPRSPGDDYVRHFQSRPSAQPAGLRPMRELEEDCAGTDAQQHPRRLPHSPAAVVRRQRSADVLRGQAPVLVLQN